MTQFRVELSRFAERVQEISREMHPGDVLIVEEAGRIVGEFRPVPSVEYPVRDNLRRFLEARRTQPPIDDEFVAAVEEAGRQANRPAEASPWE